MNCIQRRSKYSIGGTLYASLMSSVDFSFETISSKNNNKSSGIQAECQTVWIQMMPNIFSLFCGFRQFAKFISERVLAVKYTRRQKLSTAPNIFSVTVIIYEFLQKNYKCKILLPKCVLGLSNLSECHLILLLKFCGVLYTPTPICGVYP